MRITNNLRLLDLDNFMLLFECAGTQANVQDDQIERFKTKHQDRLTITTVSESDVTFWAVTNTNCKINGYCEPWLIKPSFRSVLPDHWF